jgi:soluble lytic murein transglycosylase
VPFRLLTWLLAGAVWLCAPAGTGAQAPDRAAAQNELRTLARALRDSPSPARYNRLKEFAERHAKSELGARAALALGYHDSANGLHALAERWLKQAEADAVLREYAVYWRALALRGLKREADALAQLEDFRRDFPESVMAEPALAALAEAALALNRPERALAVLQAQPNVEARPALLLLRGLAQEQMARLEGVAADYVRLYYDWPLSEEAGKVAGKLTALERALGEKFPAPTASQRVARAAAFYDARRWRDARLEYERLAPRLDGVERERASLRIAHARAQLGAGPAPLAELALTDAELDAERLYLLSQAHRAREQEAEMLAAVEQAALRASQSPWAEEALFAGGNYFWLKLDRARAAEFYRRATEQFPAGKNAAPAAWRAAWAAYLERRPEAAALFEDYVRRFPATPQVANALYWLGRAAERAGNVPHARSFYLKLAERFPHNYFAFQAEERMRALGEGPTNASDVLPLVPPPPPLPGFEQAIPTAAAARWRRADALRVIAFDASAELELRAAHAATGSAFLLLEAAQAAVAAGRYTASITAARQAVPQLEARRFDEVPEQVWRTVYPLPYAAEIERHAARNHLDPRIVAGLIRQESIFQRDAVSRAGAVGLMQVLPSTGRRVARQLRLGYARARLFQADYNIRLGTAHLENLRKQFDTLEKALAAYNAGEHRVVPWLAERNFDEPAEFVESIPFTETREYVQIVIRNAEIYRRLYGQPR